MKLGNTNKIVDRRCDRAAVRSTNSEIIMAKQTKAPATAPTEGSAAAPKAPAIDRGVNDTFRAVFENGKPVEPKEKLAPQAMVILNGVRAAGKSGVKRSELIKNITGVLVTKQPVGRIISYYQKELVASGALTLEKSADAAAPASK